MQSTFRSSILPIFVMTALLGLGIYIPLLSLCLLPAAWLYIRKSKGTYILVAAGVGLGTASPLGTLLPTAAIIDHISYWHAPNNLIVPGIIAALIALSYVHKIRFATLLVGYMIMGWIVILNSAELIIEKYDEQKNHTIHEMDRTLSMLNYLDIEDCLVNQKAGTSTCFIFDKKLPITTIDDTVTQNIREIAGKPNSSYSWAQKIRLDEGKFFNSHIGSVDEKEIEAVIGLKSNDNSVTMLIDTRGSIDAKSTAMHLLTLCLSLIAYGVACLCMAYKSITTHQAVYMLASLSLMLIAATQSHIIAPLFVLPCLIVFISQKVNDIMTEFTVTKN